MIHNLKAFLEAVAGTTEHPFTSEHMVHNVEALDAIARAAEDRRSSEIAGLG